MRNFRPLSENKSNKLPINFMIQINCASSFHRPKMKGNDLLIKKHKYHAKGSRLNAEFMIFRGSYRICSFKRTNLL